MKVTLKDVAKEAGVSSCLVSRYVNHSPLPCMTEKTRCRIAAAVAKLHYRPSLTARALKAGRTKTLGLLIGNLTNAFFAHFADAALRRVQEEGYQLLIALFRSGAEKDAALQNLLARQVDAVFSPEEILRCGDKEFETPRFTGWDTAFADAFAALRHAGCSSCAVLFFPESGRKEMFAAAARTAEFSSTSFDLDFDEAKRLEKLRMVCAGRPDAIFSNGWQTTEMLCALLKREFPGYAPKLLPHVNCCGAFLEEPGILGAICNSESAWIDAMVRRMIAALNSKETPPEEFTLPVRFLPAAELAANGMSSGRFRLS